MQVCLTTETGVTRITLSTNDVSSVATKLNQSTTKDDIHFIIRRHINRLLDKTSKNIVFFTTGLQAVFHLMLTHKMFGTSHASLVERLIDNYQMYTLNVKNLPPKLISAMCNCIDHCHNLCGHRNPREVVSYMNEYIFPKIDIKVMCFMHQILSRIILVWEGEVALTNDTFIDKVVQQTFDCFDFYNNHSKNDVVHIVKCAQNTILKQMTIFYKHHNALCPNIA